jgi:hypothetical protein
MIKMKLEGIVACGQNIRSNYDIDECKIDIAFFNNLGLQNCNSKNYDSLSIHSWKVW